MQSSAVGAAISKPHGEILLDGYAALETVVVGPVSNAEPARTENRSNLETVDLCPFGKCQLVVRRHRLMESDRQRTVAGPWILLPRSPDGHGPRGFSILHVSALTTLAGSESPANALLFPGSVDTVTFGPRSDPAVLCVPLPSGWLDSGVDPVSGWFHARDPSSFRASLVVALNPGRSRARIIIGSRSRHGVGGSFFVPPPPS